MIMDAPQRLMTPAEVGVLFRVDPKTVGRWASAGRIRSIRTPGGHRRFLRSEMQDLLDPADPSLAAIPPVQGRIPKPALAGR